MLPCESYIDRLENKGLIVSGHGITAADALHDLLSGLYVIPIRANLLSKTAAFLHLTFMIGFVSESHTGTSPPKHRSEKRITAKKS